MRLALTSGRTRREIAEDLGIGLSTLTRWLSQERDLTEPSEAPVDLHAELKRLRRENAILKQERDILKKAAAFLISMSGRGECYNNSMVETFFKTIKSELIWLVAWQSRQQAENAVARYIDGFYNPLRRHSSLGFQSPIAFERKAREVS